MNQTETPHDLTAEQSTLGACLIAADAIAIAAEILTPTDFYREGHRVIFAAILELFGQGKDADFVTVFTELQKRGEVETAGGLETLQYLVESCPSSANVAAYAEPVKAASRQRALLVALETTKREVLGSEYSATETIDRAGERVLGLGESSATNAPESLSALLTAEIAAICTRYENPLSATGAATGLPELDRMTGGLQPQELTILAARPAMGKSALSMQIALQVAQETQKPVLFFSLEMSKAGLIQRILSGESEINSRDFREGAMDDMKFQRLETAMETLQAAPLFIDDTPAATPFQLLSRSRSVAARRGQLALIVVDYLQLIHSDSQRGNRTEQISEISRALKLLARQQNCPVLALSQLSRAVEQREDKRPLLSDLRESGSIEQDADVVQFLYRPEYYRRKEAGAAENEYSQQEECEIILGKQRSGPCGTVKVGFEGRFTRFVPLPTFAAGSHWDN